MTETLIQYKRALKITIQDKIEELKERRGEPMQSPQTIYAIDQRIEAYLWVLEQMNRREVRIEND